jgi:hypothetical protein
VADPSELPTLATLSGDTSTREALRRIAIAGLLGTVFAIICEVLLRAALGTVDVEGSRTTASWLFAAALTRIVWPIAAALLWLAAPSLASRLEGNGLVPALRATPAAAARVVGVAMMAIPVVWVLATALVRALTITINDAWDTDGRIFAAPQFYSDIVVSYAPWILAGMALAAAAGHLHLARR